MRDGLDRGDGVAADKVDGDGDEKGDCEFERVVDSDEVKEEVAPTVEGSAGVLKDGFSRRDGAAANSNTGMSGNISCSTTFAFMGIW